jgi:hypothetical protein
LVLRGHFYGILCARHGAGSEHGGEGQSRESRVGRSELLSAVGFSGGRGIS